MTANTKVFDDLINSEAPKEANTQAAVDFRKLNELGFNAMEFTVYGCCFADLQGHRKYFLTSDLVKAYDFFDRSIYDGICATPVHQISIRKQVPSGFREDVILELKLKLAKMLQSTYSLDFLNKMRLFQVSENTDYAFEGLIYYQEFVEDSFDYDLINVFEHLTKQCFKKKILSKRSLYEFQSWIGRIKNQMAQDAVVHDLYEKNMYGFAYRSEKGAKYLTNALKSSCYQKILEIEDQAFPFTPVMEKWYTYNHEYTIKNVQSDFKNHIKKVYNDEFMTLIKKLNLLQSGVDQKAYMRFYHEKSDDVQLMKTLNIYKTRWNIS